MATSLNLLSQQKIDSEHEAEVSFMMDRTDILAVLHDNCDACVSSVCLLRRCYFCFT